MGAARAAPMEKGRLRPSDLLGIVGRFRRRRVRWLCNAQLAGQFEYVVVVGGAVRCTVTIPPHRDSGGCAEGSQRCACRHAGDSSTWVTPRHAC